MGRGRPAAVQAARGEGDSCGETPAVSLVAHSVARCRVAGGCGHLVAVEPRRPVLG